MFATILFIIFCLPFSSHKTSKLKYINYILLYGSETQSLTLGEEHRLRVFEKSMLRRISGSKMEEKLHNLYISSNIIRVVKGE
jgi:hypothetical protein